MEHKNRKVLLLSTVRDLLASQGWSLDHSFNQEYIFKNDAGEILGIPKHPTKARLINLDDLLGCTQLLREEFTQAARLEWDISSSESLDTEMQFNLHLNPGACDVADIHTLFSSLSDLNRAVDGFGLTFLEPEAIT